jgi:nucleotidyltransferase/DNA polymerase involved in DNA repair
MTAQDLHAKIQATKRFLRKEIIRNKLVDQQPLLSFREIGVRMDMLHEAERVGVRNLGERQNRKLTRMIEELEERNGMSLN